MHRGLTLNELATKIEAQRALKADYVFPAASLQMKVQDDKTPVIDLPDTGDFPVLPFAHGQLSEKLEIPRKYYDRCLTDSPTLLAENVNHWFKQSPKVRMLRTLGGD